MEAECSWTEVEVEAAMEYAAAGGEPWPLRGGSFLLWSPNWLLSNVELERPMANMDICNWEAYARKWLRMSIQSGNVRLLWTRAKQYCVGLISRCGTARIRQEL